MNGNTSPLLASKPKRGQSPTIQRNRERLDERASQQRWGQCRCRTEPVKLRESGWIADLWACSRCHVIITEDRILDDQ